MNRDSLEKLLLEVAPLVDALALTRYDNGNWWFAFANSLSVEVAMNEANSRMALFAKVGELPEQNQSACMKMMLAYNYLWNVHGGLCLALDNSLQNALLMLDTSVNDLTVPLMANVLINFCQAASGWRDHFATLIAEKATSEGNSAFDPSNISNLRV